MPHGRDLAQVLGGRGCVALMAAVSLHARANRKH